MDAQPSLVRLALGGLLLDPRAYRAQRDHPAGLRRGLVLVLLIGLLVGLAALIGDLGESLTQPDPRAVSEVVLRGLTSMPWYQDALVESPELAANLEQAFGQPGALPFTPSPLSSAAGVVLTPLFGLLGWLISGTVVHIAAKAFGGAARFGQTLAVTALASSASLLGLVQVVPYAEQIPGSLAVASGLLGLIATYVGVREAHGLPGWRSFWAVLIGPLLLSVLAVALYCCVVFVFASAMGSLAQGAAR
jgi:hypothetical protein